MAKEEEEEVDIIDLKDFMGDNIGESSEQEETEKELQEALDGKEEQSPLYNKEDLEEDVEVKEPEETKEEESEKEESPSPKDESKDEDSESSFYRETLRTLFGDELDTITIENEEGEEEEVALDDFKFDADTFKEIVDSKRAIEKEEATKDKVDLNSLSKMARDILEIEDKGGNITQVLEAKQSYIDPLENLDLSKEDDQRQVIYLRSKAKGLPDEDINAIIKGYEASDILSVKAKEAKGELEKSVEDYIEAQKKQAEDLKAKLEDENKEYRKKFKSNLTQNFELKDSVQKKIVDVATKLDDKGNYEVDKLYMEATKDPQKMAKIALFLLDEDEFLAQVSRKKVTEEKLKTARTIKITGSKKSVHSNRDVSRKESKDLVDLSELK